MNSDYLLTVYPTTEANWPNENVRTEGLVLRDHFAGLAMLGILSNPGQLDNVNDDAANWVARDAYLVADAMLKARNK